MRNVRYVGTVILFAVMLVLGIEAVAIMAAFQ